MKSKKAFLFIAATIVFLITIVSLKQKRTTIEKSELEQIQIAKSATSSESTTMSPEKSEHVVQLEFKKCFKKQVQSEDLQEIMAELLRQKDYAPPILSEESYELQTIDDKSLVVQVLPEEEEKNKVRVFAINKLDGLPDRIKDFPEVNSPFVQKLNGALSLGTLKSKGVSTNQMAYDGSMLSIDKKDEKVVRLHLITKSFEFECKNQSCLCLTKE